MKFAAKLSLALLVSALLASSAAGHGMVDPFSHLYANTLVYTLPDKTIAKVHAFPDGTWTSTSTNPSHPTNHGEWARLGDWLCSTSAAVPDAEPWCRKVEVHKVGDKWIEERPDKTIAQIELVAGR